MDRLRVLTLSILIITRNYTMNLSEFDEGLQLFGDWPARVESQGGG